MVKLRAFNEYEMYAYQIAHAKATRSVMALLSKTHVARFFEMLLETPSLI